jgi:diamine N-acetyltransferase
MAAVELVLLDRFNWEACLSIQLTSEQESFVPPVLYSLAQAKFESLTAYGVQYGGEMVGFLMSGQFAGICWLSRVLIDKGHQGQGLGSMAVRQWLRREGQNPHCREVRTSYAVENYAAANFFNKLGFSPLPDSLEEEIVARYEG